MESMIVIHVEPWRAACHPMAIVCYSVLQQVLPLLLKSSLFCGAVLCSCCIAVCLAQQADYQKIPRSQFVPWKMYLVLFLLQCCPSA